LLIIFDANKCIAGALMILLAIYFYREYSGLGFAVIGTLEG